MNKVTLEHNLSKLTGIACEITIRGLRAFTISFEGENAKAIDCLKRYFNGHVKTWESDYDLECNHTAIYFTA
jgi:hypothetical protein